MLLWCCGAWGAACFVLVVYVRLRLWAVFSHDTTESLEFQLYACSLATLCVAAAACLFLGFSSTWR
jgi:hypothetical protein